MAERSEFQVTIQGTGDPAKVRDAVRHCLKTMNAESYVKVTDAALLHGPESNRQREDVWPLQGGASAPAKKAHAAKK